MLKQKGRNDMIKEIHVDELKSIQLDMLKDIDRFCTEHGIRYSLAFGTLLGAVRHKGFIPWDDDIDIMMPREDYERFLKGYCRKDYKVVSLESDSNYALPFAKVYNDKTVMKEDVEVEIHYGVYIDIFPIDYIVDTDDSIKAFLRKKKFFDSIHTLKVVSVKRGRSVLKNIVLLLAHTALFPISANRITRKVASVVAEYSRNGSMKAGIVVPTDCRYKSIVPSTYFESYTGLEFEAHEFSVISHYDEWLTSWYGNYMELPPKEKQISHHVFKAWWK